MGKRGSGPSGDGGEESGEVRDREDDRGGDVREGEVRAEHGDGGERRDEDPRPEHHHQAQDGRPDQEGDFDHEAR